MEATPPALWQSRQAALLRKQPSLSNQQPSLSGFFLWQLHNVINAALLHNRHINNALLLNFFPLFVKRLESKNKCNQLLFSPNFSTFSSHSASPPYSSALVPEQTEEMGTSYPVCSLFQMPMNLAKDKTVTPEVQTAFTGSFCYELSNILIFFLWHPNVTNHKDFI